MAGQLARPAAGGTPESGRPLGWLRVAGLITLLPVAVVWLVVLGGEWLPAALVGLVLAAPFLVLAGPAWTYPTASGMVLVVVWAIDALITPLFLWHSASLLRAEVAMTLPLFLAGFLLLAGWIGRRRARA